MNGGLSKDGWSNWVAAIAGTAARQAGAQIRAGATMGTKKEMTARNEITKSALKNLV